MKSLIQQIKVLSVGVTICLISGSIARGQGDDRYVGVWETDQESQIVELLFRSNGRYQLDTRSTDPVFDFSSTERGRYRIDGRNLFLAPYDYFGDPTSRQYDVELSGDSLTLTRVDFPLSPELYQFKSGSRADVLARESVERDLVATWGRHITFSGQEEFTFRPGGYYFLKDTPESNEFPPQYIRGRYEQDGARLTVTPYSGIDAEYEVDFFGDTLTLILDDGTFGESKSYQIVAGSATEVRQKSAEAEALLGRAPDRL